MRTLYFYKSHLGYQEYPVPSDLENFYEVQVQDNYEWDGKAYDPTSNSFVTNSDTDAVLILAKLNEINEWYEYQRENGYVVYNGNKYDLDKTARENLTSILLAGAFTLDYWTTYDNIDIPSTFDDIKNIHALIVERGSQLHARQRKMKTEVAQLTGDAINNYVVSW